ncbi:hypothetical protein F4808DRAFT_470597 [Astrocystis sublimbata]|nr:hypothetical protein F4808DRAFT_470597 [Astrocystis sublimbata]
MEQHHVPRRSASHGTLRSSCSSHGGSGVAPSPARSFHKPLRSVNENAILLHSPGALESMLKTTTETGDIGIFTIKPVPPSPLAPRNSISGVGPPRPKPQRSVDSLYRQNLSMQPLSHRDATSEVLSVYGSESIKSVRSAFSPTSTEDLAQRSYSITTCGSRHLSHYKSTNTLQSQASGSSNLQRPRSPFPYPTRLKRPGFRPASPAVTENGQVDYSRMVEIDRVSYRTVHGRFNNPCSPISDVNRSTPSLAPPGPPPNCYDAPRPPPPRPCSPASMTSWNAPVHGRLDSAFTRASSLSSVSHTYRRVPTLPRAAQSFPSFETKPTRLDPYYQTIGPSAPRVGRYPQPTGYQEDIFGEGDSAFYDAESHVVDDQGQLPAPDLGMVANRDQAHAELSNMPAFSRHLESESSQSSTNELDGQEVDRNRNSDIDLLPSQTGRDSFDTFNPSLDVESRDITPPYHYVGYHANTAPKGQIKSPERQVQVFGGRCLTIRSEQGVILRDDIKCETDGKQTPEIRNPHVEVDTEESCSLVRSSEVGLDVSIESQDPLEKHEYSVQAKGEENLPSTGCIEGLNSETTLDSPTSGRPGCSSLEDELPDSDEPVNERIDSEMNDEVDGPSHHQQIRRHRRNHAVLRISTTTLPREDNEGYPHITPTCSTVPLVSPKPISPARQLKVKNSIPQLMKALPPLPGALGYDLPLVTNHDTEEDHCAEILVPFSFDQPNGLTRPSQLQANNLGPVAGSDKAPSAKMDGPKFRLKVKTNSSSETSQADENMPDHVSTKTIQEDLGEKNTRSCNQNKLKVRSPRRRRQSSSHYSTVRHNPGLETRQILTDLIIQREPRDLFSTPPKSDTILLRKRRKPIPQLDHTQAVNNTNCEVAHSAPSDDRVNSDSCRTSSNNTIDKKKMRASSRGVRTSSIPPHGLMKHLSNIRALISVNSSSAARTRTAGSLRIHRISSSACNNANLDINHSLKTSSSSDTDISLKRFGRRIRARLSKWVKGSKVAMRKCAANRRYNQDDQHGTEKT